MQQCGHENIIKKVIDLEKRISCCRRCPELFDCVPRPSTGKGDLTPAIMLVLECESIFHEDEPRLIAFRNIFKDCFATDKIYHSFVVRCQPKSCVVRHSANFITNTRLINAGSRHCLINHQPCEGIPVQPNVEVLINCASYIWEEIKIVQPQLVITLGSRVSEFILRAGGLCDGNYGPGRLVELDGILYATTVGEREFNAGHAAGLRQQVKAFKPLLYK